MFIVRYSPDIPSFYFETHIRRSISVIPQWTTWKAQENLPEEIHSYDIICIYLSFECIIEKTSLPINRLNEIYMTGKGKEYELLDFLISVEKHNERTKEQFICDFNEAIKICNESLNTD